MKITTYLIIVPINWFQKYPHSQKISASKQNRQRSAVDKLYNHNDHAFESIMIILTMT